MGVWDGWRGRDIPLPLWPGFFAAAGAQRPYAGATPVPRMHVHQNLLAPPPPPPLSSTHAHPLSCAVSHRWSQEIEEGKVQPELYPYGSRGPVGAHYLAAKYGVRWGDHNSDEL